MKKNFNLDDLEEFLADSADQHRMYPSDRVWRNIDQELHGKKSWPALTFASFLTGAVITAGLILIHPDKNLFTIEPIGSAGNVETTSSAGVKTLADNKNLSPTTTNTKPSQAGVLPINSTFDYTAATNSPSKNAEEPKQEQPPLNADLAVVPKTEPINSGNVETEKTVVDKELTYASSINVVADDDKSAIPLAANVITEVPTINNQSEVPGTISQVTPSVETPGIKFIAGTSNATASSIQKKKEPKFGFTVYGTPSISYRYLSENKIIDLHFQNGPLAPNLTNGVDKFVTQFPIMGFELGGGIFYNLTPAVRLKTGFQFNLRGYKMDAFTSNREQSTIVLNRGLYTDSLIAISSVNTQNGYATTELTNRYFEISIPVGVDMKVVDWKKLKLYVGASFQPTYQFNDNMYLVSSDYKKYVQEPEIVRHWNMNSTIEAFATYQMGGVTWQVGPQVRYQVFPGTINQYPIRERLIDYGLKVGVVKTIK